MDVTVEQGVVRGTALDTGGELFAGLPFAAPPVGSLRFQPPQPPAAWDGVRESAFGAPPLQPAGGDEDCLTLNVWTPPTPGPHPVLFFIFGGGFENGSASPPGTDAALLAERLDAVVVATNYRLGALGWLHLGGTSTNLGLQDVVAALRWTQSNVAGFGGDPDRVTVAGVSAGAFIIGSLLATPTAKELFARGILHSGSTGRTYPVETASSIADELLQALEVDGPAALVDVPASTILDLQASVIQQDIGQRNLPGGRAWGLVVDGTVLPEDPQAVVERGDVAHLDLLICTTTEEVKLYQVMQAATFAPADDDALQAEMGAMATVSDYRDRYPDDDLATLRMRFLTDAIYRDPARRLAEAQVAAGGRAWLSEQSASPAGPMFGACHGSDMAYLFDGVPGLPFPPIPAEQHPIRDRMHETWRRFVHEGDPGWAVGSTLDYGDGSVR